MQRRIARRIPWILCLNLAAALVCGRSATCAQEAIDFEKRIAPILVARCLECHHESIASGGLVLSRREQLFAPTKEGTWIAPGKPSESRMLDKLVAGEMPPEKNGKSQKLSTEELSHISTWIAQGAQWPEGRELDQYELTTEHRAGRDWWSLQPIRRPGVPIRWIQRESHGHELNSIDAFILDKLSAAGMKPAEESDRKLLIRRLYFDLIGLPPATEEVANFVADQSPDAWQRLVDRLLASPRYGERWGRYWLDVVRYADTCGYERDQEKPFAWKYRDWVVAACNSDLPYDQFIIDQVAGDEIPIRTTESLVATGFLRLGTWNDEPNDPEDYKYERIEDMVHATSAAFLGLTVKCARCHDHKFAPIPQADSYRMAAAFWAGPIDPRGRELLGGPSGQELGEPDILGWTDLQSQPKPLHVLKNGDRHKPLGPVTARAISAIPSLDVPFQTAASNSRTSVRRFQFARWIARYDHPLTARVMVNRLWQHHFGEALVRSPNNFGFTGAKPTHPELLDWLADELLNHQWHTKPLHRQMLLSRTYRQAVDHAEYDAYSQRDFDNLLLWRAHRRRLDAEALRDSLLMASGDLDLQIGGPGFKPSISDDALEGLSRKTAAWKASPMHEQMRRSIYQFTQRSLLPPLMTTFDFTDTTLPCERRDVTTVAPQALALLNDPFVHQRSLSLAKRVLARQVDSHAVDSANSIWQSVLGRTPSSVEIELAQDHLLRQQARLARASTSERQGHSAQLLALASLCQVLFNSNEFIYVD